MSPTERGKMEGLLEIIITTNHTYLGRIITEQASSFDKDDNDVPCVILEPLADKGVEIWIPVTSIQSRNVVVYAD